MPPHRGVPLGSPSGGGGSSCTAIASTSACMAVHLQSSVEVAWTSPLFCVARIHALRAHGSIIPAMSDEPAMTNG